MAAIDLSTAGILFAYGVETTKGTKPTAFTRIAGAKFYRFNYDSWNNRLYIFEIRRGVIPFLFF